MVTPGGSDCRKRVFAMHSRNSRVVVDIATSDDAVKIYMADHRLYTQDVFKQM
jgi:hypothetical protein